MGKSRMPAWFAGDTPAAIILMDGDQGPRSRLSSAREHLALGVKHELTVG